MPRKLTLDTPVTRDPVDAMRVTVLNIRFDTPTTVQIDGSLGEMSGGIVERAPGFTLNQSFLQTQSGIPGLTFGDLLDALTEGILLDRASSQGRSGQLE